MAGKFLISEDERKHILNLHESASIENTLRKENLQYGNDILSNEVKNLLFEFYNQLEFQKKICLQVTESFSIDEKFNILKRIQNEQFTHLFPNSNLIFEHSSNFYDEITKFNDFLFLSLCQKIGLVKESVKQAVIKWVKNEYVLSEQRISDLPQNQQTSAGPTANIGAVKKGSNLYSQIPDSEQKQTFLKQQKQTEKEFAIQRQNYDKSREPQNIVTNAINYIKQNGIATIMESLRSALLSIGGVAVQTVLAFTGAGAIVNDVAWGILTLYDGYQYFVNRSTTALFNLVIDVICLVTAGTLGSVLGKYVGKAATSISQAVKTLIEGGAGNAIKGVLETLKTGSSVISKWLGQASTFMKQKMGIEWASTQVENIINFFKSLVSDFSNLLGSGVAKVASPVARAGVTLAAKFDAALLQGIENLSEEAIKKYVSKGVEQISIKTAKKEIESFRDKSTEEALRFIDQKFGSDMGDLFALYMASKGLSSQPKNLTQLSQKTAVEAIRKQGDPTQMRSGKADTIQKSGQGLAGKL